MRYINARLSPRTPRLRGEFLVLLIVVAVAGLAGCESIYYDTMETFGTHKRDILVDRVAEGRQDQQEAKEQFENALEEFSAVVGFTGGDLREQYETLKSELEQSERRAEDVRERIESIEEVAAALFEEWEAELDQYQSVQLRQKSAEQLQEVQGRYDQLIFAMRRAAEKMEPVLLALNDQVLYLKHNLNAQAIASLQDEAVALESDVASLIAEMENAIAEAQSFIDAMGQG